MKIGTIYYLIPPNTGPSGGIQTRYQHCIHLRSLGYRAYPLHRTDYDIGWFKHEIEYKRYKDTGFSLSQNDIVVGSEVFPYEALLFRKAIKIIFVQGWALVYYEFYEPKWYQFNLRRKRSYIAGLRPQDRKKNYHQLGFDHILSNSEYIHVYLKEKMGVESGIVSNRIDLSRFHINGEKNRNPNSVIVLTRRNFQQTEQIMAYIQEHYRHVLVNWILVDGVSQEELIEKYQHADVFLAMGYPEGRPRPPLEAMACGCAVVGFTGGGGRDYMINDETALVAEDGDWETAAKLLIKILEDKELKEKIRLGGIKIAKQNGQDRMRADLKSYYSSIETLLL